MMQQPTSEPMQHPCRCETCDNKSRYFHPSRKEWREGMTDGMDMCPITISTFTKRYGCCSSSANTDAQARIDAVVKELETMQSDAKKKSDHAHDIEDGKWNGCNLTDAPDAELKVLKKAIALLKEGVGK